MTMDGFLFKPQSQKNYELPGNDIPDALINEVSFISGSNTLYGYWVKSDGTRPGLTILYCHGNKKSIDEYWDRVMLLHELGVNVFIFDYRGFGKSEGESSEKGLFEDGTAAFNYIRTQYGVTDDSISIYGYSLGNVVSIYLASISKPICLIAEAPFASTTSIIQGSASLDIPPLWLTEGEFNNAETIKLVTSPILLFHGEMDDLVRYRDNGRVVFENAPDNPKKAIILSEANHTDIPDILGKSVYLDEIMNWIKKSIANDFSGL